MPFSPFTAKKTVTKKPKIYFHKFLLKIPYRQEGDQRQHKYNARTYGQKKIKSDGTGPDVQRSLGNTPEKKDQHIVNRDSAGTWKGYSPQSFC
jgi:hypothetical protein